MSLSTAVFSVRKVGPQVQTSPICCELLGCVLSWVKGLHKLPVPVLCSGLELEEVECSHGVDCGKATMLRRMDVVILRIWQSGDKRGLSFVSEKQSIL